MLCTGIFGIKFGDIAADGGIATGFAALGRTREGTLAFNASDDQTQDINVEEQDDPVMQTVTTKGTLDLNWSMVDWDNDVMISVFGGQVVNGQWQAPDQTPTVEKSLRVEPKDGKAFIYPRVKVTGKVNYDSTGKIFQIDITCRKLKPNKAGTPGFMWGDPTA
jgi:hypothetical protein